MEREIDITLKLEQAQALNDMQRDTIKQQGETIRHMKHIIIALIVSFSAIICFGFVGFVWYESQFEYTSDTAETTVYTEGDNASAEYNDVSGNQYNDNASHTESNK